MTKQKPSQSRDEANAQSALVQQAAPLGKSPTSGQLIFNMVLAVVGLFAATVMFITGIGWASHGSTAAGTGLILAGLFIFWRGGNRLSWACAEIKMRRQK
jgi:hypothetical protein